MIERKRKSRGFERDVCGYYWIRFYRLLDIYLENVFHGLKWLYKDNNIMGEKNFS